jgi:uncharacterized protein (DUF427 family)
MDARISSRIGASPGQGRRDIDKHAARISKLKAPTTMKIPGADHPISITPHSGRVRVLFNGCVVADSNRALALHEKSYPPRFYIPREDAQMTLFERTAHSSHCPYKGDAAYYSIRVGEAVGENAIWSYEHPYPAVAEIAGRLAFYPNRVDAIEVMTA